LWCTVAIVFFLFELGHPGLFFYLAFSCGAVAALIATLFDASDLLLQAVSFFLGTVVSLSLLRYFIRRNLHHKTHRTNIDALVGRHGFVITAITPMQPGSVKIGGQLWMAVSAHQEHIPVNTAIEIVCVRGAHLVVTPVAQ
jgi:membrane protein implicated in regulation of membrane protease activity